MNTRRSAHGGEETLAVSSQEGEEPVAESRVHVSDKPVLRCRERRNASGRLLDLKAAETYSGISAWTLRDLIASGELPAVRPPGLRRVWIDRADLDKAIADWKERAG